MSSGGSNDTTTTTTTQMSPQQAALYRSAKPFISQYTAQGGAQPAPTQTVVPFTPAQQAAQGMALESAGGQGQIAQSAAGAQNFLTSGAALDPRTNPYLMETINYAIAPALGNLTTQMLPAIRGEAVTTGNFGSSRQGIAESSALSDAFRQMLGTGATIATRGYETGLGAMGDALRTTGLTQQAQTQPAATVSAVGEAQQAQAQAELDAANRASLYNSQLPLITAQQILGLLGMTPGGSATSTAQGPTTSGLSTALGIGAMGGSLLPILLGSRNG